MLNTATEQLSPHSQPGADPEGRIEREQSTMNYRVETYAPTGHPETNADANCVGETYAGVFDTVGSCEQADAARIAAAYCGGELSQLEDVLDMRTAEQKVATILRDAAKAMVEYAELSGLTEPMETTAVIAKTFTSPVAPYRCYVAVAHCGDSRFYNLVGGEIEFVTLDHSPANGTLTDNNAEILQQKLDNFGLAEKLENNPAIYGTETLAKHFENRRYITSSLSSDGTAPDVRVATRLVRPGQSALLLMSDGVSDNLTLNLIARRVYEQRDTPLKLPEVLIADAVAVSEDPDDLRHKSDYMAVVALVAQ